MLKSKRNRLKPALTLTSLIRKIYVRLPVIRELLAITRVLGAMHDVEVIRILDLELKSDPRYQDPKRLLRYQAQTCSQNGEDGIIREIFKRIGVASRVFVEIGAGNGIENNTASLLSQGWSGFWIDGDRSFLKALEGRSDLQDNCLKSRVSFVTRENIQETLVDLGVPHEFDLLSIDVDYNTYYIWEALSAYRPRATVIEYNAAIPPDVDWKAAYEPGRPWDYTQNYGASLKALEILGRRLGHCLVGCDFLGVNAFFVSEDLVGEKFALPHTSENHYEPGRLSMMSRRAPHAAAILQRTQEGDEVK